MRKRDGKLENEALRPTLFVPMTGSAEDARKVQPDPVHPHISNGGFEDKPLDSGFIPDWYYQRQLSWLGDPQPPEGEHIITFKNDEPGKPALAMQGFPIDGRQVVSLEVSAWVKCNNIRQGRDGDELPAVVVTFYDENRKPLGNRWIGPFRGTSGWTQQKETLRVSPTAREAILRIGLFGAVGEISFDDVRVVGSVR